VVSTKRWRCVWRGILLSPRSISSRKTIHNAGALELYAIDRGLVGALVARLERRMAFSLSVSDRELYLSIDADQLTGGVVRLKREV
jgi:hypothetical protein